jgi:bifunctional non-homologous end joining protein LigD
MLDAMRAALRLRVLLAERGFETFPKTSGGDGLHVFAPLDEPREFGRVRAFCEELAADLGDDAVNVDCLQNHARRSLVAPYSLRAADLPVVSTPVTWAEIERGEQLAFGPDDVVQRIAELGDLFAPLVTAGG